MKQIALYTTCAFLALVEVKAEEIQTLIQNQQEESSIASLESQEDIDNLILEAQSALSSELDAEEMQILNSMAENTDKNQEVEAPSQILNFETKKEQEAPIPVNSLEVDSVVEPVQLSPETENSSLETNVLTNTPALVEQDLAPVQEVSIFPAELPEEAPLMQEVKEEAPVELHLEKTTVQEVELYAPEKELSSTSEEAIDMQSASFSPQKEEGEIQVHSEISLTEKHTTQEPSLEKKKIEPLDIENIHEEPALVEKTPIQAPTISTKRDLSSPISVAQIEKTSKTTHRKNISVAAPQAGKSGVTIDMKTVFAGSPTIYSLLLLLSVAMISLCLYHFLTLRKSEVIPSEKLKELRQKIAANDFIGAANLCYQEKSFFFKVVAAGLTAKEMNLGPVSPAMKTEAKRITVSFWQRLHLLNDIAIIAPMLGLLGTVLGMFYAFYDINRTSQSVLSLFDGLGISVGTTVAGIFVAIFAMIFHSLSKYKLVQVLAKAENESEELAQIIERPSINFEQKS